MLNNVTWNIFMRSHDDLRNYPGLSSVSSGEPGTQSPFELAPAGLLVDDNNIEGFILHCQQVENILTWWRSDRDWEILTT